MRVSDLYSDQSPVRGRDAYVVGLGPSMSVFPTEWLEDKACVLLNDAQKFFPRLGPIAFSNHKAFLEPLSDRIAFPIVKGRLKSDAHFDRVDNHVPWDDPRLYVFSYRARPHDPIDHYDERLLFREPDFYWKGPVAVFALQFLLQAGARSITIVGCDSVPMDGADYFSPEVDDARRRLTKNSATRRGERNIRHNYEDYAAGLMRVKREAEQRFGVPIMSLTPFMGLSGPAAQLRAIREWRGLPPLRGEPERRPAQSRADMRKLHRAAVRLARERRKNRMAVRI